MDQHKDLKQIAFGGGCHWCTEAVFASLKGVIQVEQGYIASILPNDTFSEAVIVTYHPGKISLQQLTEVHLHTHSSTAQHSMRGKYRSAVYYFNDEQEAIQNIINELQQDFNEKIITQVIPFVSFKPSLPEHENYFYNNTEKPFCKTYISPKLNYLRKNFPCIINS